MRFFNNEIDTSKYVIATYFISCAKGADLRKAAWELAIGQSVGNPNVRNQWETDEIFERSSCVIVHGEDELKNKGIGLVKIGFPMVNTDWREDGISHLLCQLMGGQMDISSFDGCRLKALSFPDSVKDKFLAPKYGIDGFRLLTKKFKKPLSGAIVKPKIGMSPDVLLKMVAELIEGGCDFIKEDEIMSNPNFCTLKDRVPLISKFLQQNAPNVVYCYCINSDPPYALDRAKYITSEGGNGIHINFWSGMGVYNSLRKLDLPLFLHFQKSGDKVITDKRHKFGIDWSVICQLAGLMGVDSIHAGMWGGYLSDDELELRKTFKLLHEFNVMPALSCGMHPGLVEANRTKFGNDFIANVGGAIHGHPMGTLAGARAMRQSIDKSYGDEYRAAISIWGLTEP